jgi:hypothetical protein
MSGKSSKPVDPSITSAAHASEQQRMLHSLGNSLSAARLRLEIMSRDAGCMATQKANIEALAATLAEASEVTSYLEGLSWGGPESGTSQKA